MNQEQFKGNWNQFKGRIKETWGDLTDDEVNQLEGSFDKLVGKIQEKYGETREQIEKKVEQWTN